MLQDMLLQFDPARCAEIALLVFIAAFGLIVWRTACERRSTIEEQASLPLNDGQKE